MVKEEELPAYAVQTACLSETVLDSKGISSTRLKGLWLPNTVLSHPGEKICGNT